MSINEREKISQARVEENKLDNFISIFGRNQNPAGSPLEEDEETKFRVYKKWFEIRPRRW